MQPLEGIGIIEMAGLAPSPYCGMLLADFGAEVVIVDRPASAAPEMPGVMNKSPFDRGKRSIRVNLKTEEGADIIKTMIRHFDVLIDPYRPGSMEALGLGPEVALKINERLIYARLTGWGQHGAYSSTAGHDINYIALSGALSLFRREGERPLPPCNLLGDFAGGGMLCAMGIMLALLERQKSGKGQVVDAAMVDGAASLSTMFHGLLANGLSTPDIGTNMLDGGAHYYQVYETKDGRFLAVGAIESKFYSQLIAGLGLDPSSLPAQNDRSSWPEMKSRFADIFRTKTRDEWMSIFDGKDACVAPVLELDEVAEHPHNRERKLILNVGDIPQPAPAPRFSRTPAPTPSPGNHFGADTRSVLKELGYSGKDIGRLFENGIVEEAQ